MKREIYFEGSNSKEICATLMEPDNQQKNIVVIVPGFTNGRNGATETEIAQGLYARGIPSIRMDLNGIGKSEGIFSNHNITNSVEDVLATIREAQSEGYSKFSLFGIDMGGNAAISAAIKSNELNTANIERLCLKAPAMCPIQMISNIVGEEEMAHAKIRGYYEFSDSLRKKFKLHYSFFQDAISNDFLYEKSGQMKLVKIPTLIIHGMKDTIVPIQQSNEFVNALAPHVGVLVSVAGGDHYLRHGDTRRIVNKCILDFLSNGYEKKM